MARCHEQAMGGPRYTGALYLRGTGQPVASDRACGAPDPSGGARCSGSEAAGAASARRLAMTLNIHNTLTRRLEPFEPIEPNHVRMYVCGNTDYDL